MRRITLAAIASCLITSWIAWPQVAVSHGSITTTVLFDREIVRILNSHCVMCHSDRSLSVPLSTYEETWVRGRSIRTEILRRHMPPWPAVAGYGHFVNDNGLTVRETQFMVSWVEGLGPRNAGAVFLNVANPGVPPQAVRASAHVGHWQLGEPDLSRQLAPSAIEAGRADFVQRTVVDLGMTSARRVRALEYMPGDRRVVRAAIFSVEGTGQWLGSWTPWYGFVKLPGGAAARLPRRSRIVADIYYRGTTEAVVDRGTIGLFFDEGQAPSFTSDIVLEARNTLPAGAAIQQLRATTRVAADTHIWALRPDLIPGITSIEVTARTPDGATEILLLAKNPAIEWPTPYILKTPRLLRKGTDLSLTVQRNTVRDGPRAGRPRLIISRY